MFPVVPEKSEPRLRVLDAILGDSSSLPFENLYITGLYGADDLNEPGAIGRDFSRAGSGTIRDIKSDGFTSLHADAGHQLAR